MRLDPHQRPQQQQPQQPDEDAPAQAPPPKRRRVGGQQGDAPDVAALAEQTAGAAGGPESQTRIGERVASGAAASASGRHPGAALQTNPIDHIFQFHKVQACAGGTLCLCFYVMCAVDPLLATACTCQLDSQVGIWHINVHTSKRPITMTAVLLSCQWQHLRYGDACM